MNLTRAQKRGAAVRLAFVAGFLLIGISPLQAQTSAYPPGHPPYDHNVPSAPPKPIPPHVEAILKSLDQTGKPPAGVTGGQVYENDSFEGRDVLPRFDRDGDAITHHTWEVNARDKERLVVGSDGSAYYTTDHYKSFQTVRNPARSVELSTRPNQARSTSSRNRAANAEKPVVKLEPRLAARVMPVVEYVTTHNAPPPNTVGGRNFGNYGSDDGEVLSKVDAKGRPIHYREWDVNTKVPGRNRGAERIVTGSDGRVYYTHDHYDTFQRIK